MILLIGFTKKAFRMVKYSYKDIHLFHLVIAIALFSTSYFFEIRLTTEEYLSVLNSVGILSTFFLLAFEKVDYKAIRERYKKDVRFGNDVFPQGQVMVNTFFTLLLVEVILIGIQYFLIVFGYFTLVFLFLSIIYMMSGLIIVMGTWHGFESKY